MAADFFFNRLQLYIAAILTRSSKIIMRFTIAILATIGLASAFPNMAKAMKDMDSKTLAARYTQNLEKFSSLKKRAYMGETGTYKYVAPGKGDYRGPCPGLNTAANHGYLPHNGIATFEQYVAAQMNLYNVGLDLAVFLCTVAIPLDGDIVTTKMSIGGDATALTSVGGSAANVVGAKEGGLIVHNTFEADTSLTRDDVFLANGNNYDFNGTLFGAMKAVCKTTSAGIFDEACMTQYRYNRYQDSLTTNGNFYFGIKSLLLYGASAFVFRLMPNGTQPATLANTESFFGAYPRGGPTYQNHLAGVGEMIPPNWVPRPTPYTLLDVASDIAIQYLAKPVQFGGNVGVNNFDGEDFNGYTTNGKLNSMSAAELECLLFQLATDNVPSAVGGVVTNTLSAASGAWVDLMLKPFGTTSGCPITTGQPTLGQ